MALVTLIFSTLYGGIIGMSWNYAINSNLSFGLKLGLLGGFLLGSFLAFVQYRIVSKGVITRKESVISISSQMNLILILGVVSAVIAFIIRLLFF
jgi:hypothetical protein